MRRRDKSCKRRDVGDYWNEGETDVKKGRAVKDY